MSKLRRAAMLGLFLSTLFGLARAAGGDSSLTLKTQVGLKTWPVSELRRKLPEQTMTVDNPYYGRKKVYVGFTLLDFLKLHGPLPPNARLVFRSADGYAPSVDLAQVRAENPLIALRESTGGFERIAQGKQLVSPEPFYLVWPGGRRLKDKVPWPYQLEKIEVVDPTEVLTASQPRGVTPDSPVQKGFAHFQAQCLKCHSINLHGGDLGPELNAPRNVTEYWGRQTLKEFISDPSSFRYRDRMPSFKHLGDGAIEQIIAYLEHMKSQKIRP